MGSALSIVAYTAAGVISAYFFSNRNHGQRALTSREQLLLPGISVVLANSYKTELIFSMEEACKSKNPDAFKLIGDRLRELGLDFITKALVHGVNSGMTCSKCAKKLEYIDDLCYCPSAATDCHHINQCCPNKGKHGKLSITN